ncbi:PAS domain-containing protein, partial [Bacillus altitudinis]|uniref:PAS domain-containing protein n=1 Tax=Bacillus altitudinis TaxID=293387 RepID=UPI00307FC4EB
MKEALDYSEVGLRVTEACLGDNGLIYVKKGFLDMRGYEEREVLGKKCGLVEGDESEEIGLKEIRRAIEKKEAVSVELKKYKKCGEMFW